MVVLGQTGAAVPQIRQLIEDRLDVVSTNEVQMPDLSADYLIVDKAESDLMSDIQVCAMGLFSALPDGVVLLDESFTILWHNSTFRNILKAEG
ncbi:MAG: hypothetical protein DWH78_06905, partial [Planctomycetota bacterium]